MIMNSKFELVEIAGEYMAVPVGDEAAAFQGVVALTDATYFLLQNMKTQQTEESLLALLTNEFDVEQTVAKKDLETIINKLLELGLILE